MFGIKQLVGGSLFFRRTVRNSFWSLLQTIYIIKLRKHNLRQQFETSMINRLVKLALEFVEKYKSEGPSILVNCHQRPEFQNLLDHVKGINPTHLGIKTNGIKSYFSSSPISYFNIIEDQDISIGVFCLAQGTSLKLHDHPNMLVLSKILHGSVHSRSMDLTDRSFQQSLPKLLFQEDDPIVVGTKLEATVAFDGILKAEEVTYLTPERKNIHSFTALEDTAILDVLLPNYDDTNRFCNFYMEMTPENEEVMVNGAGHFIGEKNNPDEMIPEETTISQQEKIEKNLKPPGEKTTIIFMLPPFDMHVQLLPYEGEHFEWPKKD